MVRKKKEVYHVKPLTEGKKNIISALIDEYDIEIAEDIQDALRDLMGVPLSPGLPIMARFFFSSMNLQLASSLMNKSDIYSFAKCGDRAADRKQ